MKTALQISLVLALGLGSVGCVAGAADNANADKSRRGRDYEADADKLAERWDGDPSKGLEQYYTVNVQIGDQTIPAPTHLFGQPINAIPYHDADGITDADGNTVARGDKVLAEYFAPGEIGYAIKHHRPQTRTLDLNAADPGEMTEAFKNQDTHIEIVVGVENRDGHPGVVTLNNPQGYPGGVAGPGRFGDEDYSMIFVKPVWPEDVDVEALSANIRTMMIGFNAVTEFPGNYNGGDPLGARNPDEVRKLVGKMITAVAGSQAEQTQARDWFMQSENMVYCAELAHLSTSAGILVPLNEHYAGTLVDAATWSRFEDVVAAHNRGESTPFTELNENAMAATVTAADLSSDAIRRLEPLSRAGGSQLAFEPMTMAHMVREFFRTHVPRQIIGERLAPLQAGALAAMEEGLYDQMGLGQQNIENARDVQGDETAVARIMGGRAAVMPLFARIVDVVGINYETCDTGSAVPTQCDHDSACAATRDRGDLAEICEAAQALLPAYSEGEDDYYLAFNEAITPLMNRAATLTGPRGDDGNGLFVPPNLLHMIAQGAHPGGILGLQYVGHGIHFSMMRPSR